MSSELEWTKPLRTEGVTKSKPEMLRVTVFMAGCSRHKTNKIGRVKSMHNFVLCNTLWDNKDEIPVRHTIQVRKVGDHTHVLRGQNCHCFCWSMSNRSKNFGKIRRIFKFSFRTPWHVPHERPNQPMVSAMGLRQSSSSILQTSCTFSSVTRVEVRPGRSLLQPKFLHACSKKPPKNLCWAFRAFPVQCSRIWSKI
jgi:hypothetical protein